MRAPQVRQAIREEAEREKITIERPRPGAALWQRDRLGLRLYGGALSRGCAVWFWNKIYDGIRVNHIEPLQDAVRGYEVIYVPCHRSHIDYLLLSYLLFRNGLTPPHIAAGINLNMPVIGSLLRRGSAFFMRRSFRATRCTPRCSTNTCTTCSPAASPSVLRGRRAFAYRPHAATQDRHAGADPAQLPALVAPADPLRAGLHRLRAGAGGPHLPRRIARRGEEEGVDLRHLQGHRRPQAALWAGLGKLRRAAQAQQFLEQEQPGWRQQYMRRTIARSG